MKPYFILWLIVFLFITFILLKILIKTLLYTRGKKMVNKQYTGERVYNKDSNEYFCILHKKKHRINTMQGHKCLEHKQV